MEEVFMANSTSKTSKSKKKVNKKVTKKPEKMAKKASTRKKSVSKTARKASNKTINPELRQKMIEETAYFSAQQRGFVSDNDLDDWLAAEKEVDKTINKQ